MEEAGGGPTEAGRSTAAQAVAGSREAASRRVNHSAGALARSHAGRRATGREPTGQLAGVSADVGRVAAWWAREVRGRLGGSGTGAPRRLDARRLLLASRETPCRMQDAGCELGMTNERRCWKGRRKRMGQVSMG